MDAPAAPEGAATLFSVPGALERAQAYADLLADTGIKHGLVGPREVPRLWERHLLNCAVMERLLVPSTTVIDVGSGAGLPGLVLAIARPDLQIHLLDPLLRRTTWLQDAVDVLELPNVTVHRGRAEESHGMLSAPVVTARAVASLGKLSRWCLPLVEPGGRLLALKGRSAAAEIKRDRAEVTEAGGRIVALHTLGDDVVEEPTHVVEVVVDEFVAGPSAPGPPAKAGKGAGRRGSRAGRGGGPRGRRGDVG